MSASQQRIADAGAFQFFSQQVSNKLTKSKLLTNLGAGPSLSTRAECQFNEK
jgi:hypothetical protein